MRNTKIVATLGPATDSEDKVQALIEAGVDVFRLNASHGERSAHRGRIRRVRASAGRLGTPVGILLDLQGPKIRLGTFAGGSAVLEDGAEFLLTTEAVEGDARRASISYEGFGRDVKPGDRILIADGSVELRVLAADGRAVRCRVVDGGVVGDRKGVNLPGVTVSCPSLTEKDKADARFGLEEGVDLIALSFVRRREDVAALRRWLGAPEVPIVAKIEKPEAWEDIEGILEEADGVMVARGDLGVEVALERVPFIQKAIIERARRRGRFVITATQMLESMVHEPMPTRAEVSDVANAIYDGTDAVMLSAETSIGKHPVEAVQWMARIIGETERATHGRGFQQWPHSAAPSTPELVAEAAYRAASLSPPAAIVVLTATGRTARLVARHRPPVGIYAFTISAEAARRLSVVYGVRAVVVPRLGSTDETLAAIDDLLRSGGRLQPGDPVVLLAGIPVERMAPANLMVLLRVGELGHLTAERQRPPACR